MCEQGPTKGLFLQKMPWELEDVETVHWPGMNWASVRVNSSVKAREHPCRCSRNPGRGGSYKTNMWHVTKTNRTSRPAAELNMAWLNLHFMSNFEFAPWRWSIILSLSWTKQVQRWKNACHHTFRHQSVRCLWQKDHPEKIDIHTIY